MTVNALQAKRDAARATRPATFTLSARRIAFEGERYTAQFIGARAVHTTWEGEHMVGVVESFDDGYPVIRFADGRWASGDLDCILRVR